MGRLPVSCAGPVSSPGRPSRCISCTQITAHNSCEQQNGSGCYPLSPRIPPPPHTRSGGGGNAPTTRASTQRIRPAAHKSSVCGLTSCHASGSHHFACTCTTVPTTQALHHASETAWVIACWRSVGADTAPSLTAAVSSIFPPKSLYPSCTEWCGLATAHATAWPRIAPGPGGRLGPAGRLPTAPATWPCLE